MGEVWQARPHHRAAGGHQGPAHQHRRRPAAEMRFQREIKATARLSHQGVVPVIDAGNDPAVGLYFVMTLEHGRPLHEAWGDWTSWRDAWPAIEQILDALAYAHAYGVIHRDIKPDNILIDASGDAVLLDFGVARLKDQARSGTSAYDMLGTVEYAAPEQATGSRRRIGPWTDLYCFGIVLWEMVCGRVPFLVPDQPVQSLMLRLDKTCPPLDPRPGFAIPRGLDQVLMKMMQPHPFDRFTHPVEAREALAALMSAPLEIRTPGPPRRPPRYAPPEATDDEVGRLLNQRRARYALAPDGSLMTGPLQAPVPRTPFLGRDEILLRLSRALERWWRDPKLGVLILAGPSGSGKTRLVQELTTPFLSAAHVDGHRHHWQNGRSMREVCLSVAGAIGLPDQELREHLDWFLTGHRVIEPDVRGRLIEWAAGRSAPDRVEEARLFARFMQAAGSRRPFVLIIDGLRRLDREVLRLVDAIRAPQLPIIVMLVTRRAEVLEGQHQPRWIEPATWELGPLPGSVLDRILSEVVEVDVRTRQRLIDRAGGWPGTLMTAIRDAARYGDLVPAWPRWIAPPNDWDPPQPPEYTV
ncbi:MAG: serine/threonine-protein kinase PknK [Myxococcales bacterium]|nr:serine/threonine-protein kinase PknK [Myxococcales bacterium]